MTEKRKRGRPKCNPPRFDYNVRLTKAHAELLVRWGGGDMSAGLRWLIEAAEIMIRKKEQHER